jgi:2-iminobutanoate/2-iminopropanoate deaminase
MPAGREVILIATKNNPISEDVPENLNETGRSIEAAIVRPPPRLTARPPAFRKTTMNAPTSPRYFPMPSTGGAPLPFSEAVRLGDTLYVSGQIGNLPGSLTLAPGGIGPEARRALENIRAILGRHGSSMDHVVKCTVFLADIGEWQVFNDVYREYFSSNLPAQRAGRKRTRPRRESRSRMHRLRAARGMRNTTS